MPTLLLISILALVRFTSSSSVPPQTAKDHNSRAPGSRREWENRQRVNPHADPYSSAANKPLEGEDEDYEEDVDETELMRRYFQEHPEGGVDSNKLRHSSDDYIDMYRNWGDLHKMRWEMEQMNSKRSDSRVVNANASGGEQAGAKDTQAKQRTSNVGVFEHADSDTDYDLDTLEVSPMPLLVDVEPYKRFCLQPVLRNQFQDQMERNKADRPNQTLVVKIELINVSNDESVTFEYSQGPVSSRSVQKINTDRFHKSFPDVYREDFIKMCVYNNSNGIKTLYFEMYNTDKESVEYVDKAYENISQNLTIIQSLNLHLSVMQHQQLRTAKAVVKRIRYMCILRMFIMVVLGLVFYRMFSRMLEIKISI